MTLRGSTAAPVISSQCATRMIPFSVESEALVQGKDSLTLTVNGTGDYTLTLRSPFRQKATPPLPSPLIANLQAQLVSVSASAVRFKFTNNSGTATATGFYGLIVGSDDGVIRG